MRKTSQIPQEKSLLRLDGICKLINSNLCISQTHWRVIYPQFVLFVFTRYCGNISHKWDYQKYFLIEHRVCCLLFCFMKSDTYYRTLHLYISYSFSRFIYHVIDLHLYASPFAFDPQLRKSLYIHVPDQTTSECLVKEIWTVVLYHKRLSSF